MISRQSACVDCAYTHGRARAERERARARAYRYNRSRANMRARSSAFAGRASVAIALYACRAKATAVPQLQLTAEAVGCLAVMSDLLAIATLHISIFYSLAARWHGLQVPPPHDARPAPPILR